MLSHDAFEIANSLSEDPNLVMKVHANAAINGAFHIEIDDHDCLCGLADAVDAANSLFHPHWVPGQVIVDHDAAELKIDAFCRHLGTQENPAFRCLK